MNKSLPIVVVGSSNTDMVIRSERIPSPGETLLGGRFFMNPGGKGANQAVAAARLGGHVTLAAKVGNDLFGKNAIGGFTREGIDTSYISTDEQHPSGVALITVDNSGENTIVVASGANGNLLPHDLGQLITSLQPGSIVLMQLEIPLTTVEYVAREAKKQKATLILNPAPAAALPPALLANIDIITPNQTEAERLTGVEVSDLNAAAVAARQLQSKGIHTVIVTLGEEGSLVADGSSFIHVPALKVKAIDTTAAGDVFSGALAVGLAEKMPLIDAVKFASAAAAISVTRLGAQASAPYRNEIQIENKP